jgi:hypothetical protein
MQTPINTTLNDTTSYLSVYTSTGSFFYKNIQLPPIYPSTIGRIVYFKEASEYPGVPIYTISTTVGGSLIETSTILGVANHEAVTLQATQSSTTSYWSILNGYRGNIVFSTQVLPVQSVPVYVSSVSQVFVDLRTQSKTVVLPQIQTLAHASSSALYMTIKDAYGWAGTSSLYVSTSYPDKLEMSTINNSIQLTSNFASIDLVANSILSKWNILNFYGGDLVDRG